MTNLETATLTCSHCQRKFTVRVKTVVTDGVPMCCNKPLTFAGIAGGFKWGKNHPQKYGR